jgi:hypothetical protein
VGSCLRSRIERLEQRNRPPSHSSQGWGKSAEEIDREFRELPAEIVYRAIEIRERRERDESEDPLPLSGRSGVDCAAMLVSYGRPEDVPSEVREAVVERDRHAYAGLPKEAAREMENLWRAVVAEDFECVSSTCQAEEKGAKRDAAMNKLGGRDAFTKRHKQPSIE